MKKVYLTIDDGPSQDRKEKVDILHEHGIQAIWFCVGADLENRLEDAIYTIKKGGIIGNHSYSHFQFSKMPLEKCFEEILKTDKIIDKIYKKASVKRPIKAFRFPYGDKGEPNPCFDRPYSEEGKIKIAKIQAYLRKLGYTQPKFEKVTYNYYRKLGLLDDIDWFWTYDVLEWSAFMKVPVQGVCTLDDVLNRMDLDEPENWRGLNCPDSEDIIAIHDHPETTPMFRPIIERLVGKGLMFSPIPLK